MTWSIIARDSLTGQFGIAVATKFFAVGARVPHIAAGIGGVATQALVNPYYGIDGLTLLRVIRKHPKTASMPFIMATGRSDKEQVKEAISFGVNNYIIKPFDAGTMKKRIEAVIGALS